MSKKEEMQATSLPMVALDRESNREEIRKYFEYVIQQQHSGKEFSVDFDMVWPLVFQRKDIAIKSLELYAVKDVDYQFFRQKVENYDAHTPGRPEEKYYLTVPMLEYFIARKVRYVFNVYRRVFHHEVMSDLKMYQFSGHAYYDYMEFLRHEGMSMVSGSCRARIRRNPQEFHKRGNVWYVTRMYSGVIRKNVELQRAYQTLRERREHYLQLEAQQLLLFSKEGGES